MWVVICTSLVTTSLRDSFGAIHHERVAHWADVAGRTSFDGVFTLWII